jgi:hypothetical protein
MQAAEDRLSKLDPEMVPRNPAGFMRFAESQLEKQEYKEKGRIEKGGLAAVSPTDL